MRLGKNFVGGQDEFGRYNPKKGKWNNLQSLKKEHDLRVLDLKKKAAEDQTNSIYELGEICKFNANLRRK